MCALRGLVRSGAPCSWHLEPNLAHSKKLLNISWMNKFWEINIKKGKSIFFFKDTCYSRLVGTCLEWVTSDGKVLPLLFLDYSSLYDLASDLECVSRSHILRLQSAR